jgi:NADH-quinone oxidoreductase subunit L
MVLAGDSIVFFLGWEMMGLCSFFLIAYNTTSSQSIAAGRKAFIMTRFADAFLLAALLLLFIEARSVRLETLIPAGLNLDETRRTIIALLIFGGALGKSAQVPFHTWLPSAMAGPTPVSALLHSATMVAAGAFLMVRFYPLIAASPGVPEAAASFGVFTAIFGSLAALFQQDIKRLLAYSSISQIGLMMLSIGVGAPAVAIAHFVVHAIFKSLLFLSAGEITHGAPQGTALASMRGAYYRSPVAFFTFAAGAGSLAALPVVTAGWWSKEAVLAAVHDAGALGVILSIVGLASAVLTAAYALRPVILGLEEDDAGRHHAHSASAERMSRRFITVPLVLLACGSIVGGILVDPIIGFLGAEAPHVALPGLALGILAPLVGAGIAIFPNVFVSQLTRALDRGSWLNGRAPADARAKRQRENALRRFAYWLSQGAQVDRFYRLIFVLPFSRLVRWLNGYRTGVADPVGNWPVLASLRAYDAVVDSLAHDVFDRLWMLFAGRMVMLWDFARRLQTGRVRDYGFAMATGVAALLLIAWRTA